MHSQLCCATHRFGADCNGHYPCTICRSGPAVPGKESAVPAQNSKGISAMTKVFINPHAPVNLVMNHCSEMWRPSTIACFKEGCRSRRTHGGWEPRFLGSVALISFSGNPWLNLGAIE